MGLGSLFAGTIPNLVFCILPLCDVIPLIFLRKDSGFVQEWFSVVPIEFGNAVVFQTALIALQAHLSGTCSPLISQMAFGMAFGELFRGLGQISGVAIPSVVS
ncbi:hypothetical protein OG21DRAFT_1491300 [Imleria badia]|nr:hypothetical protein OG21DRAFT_1491300 [Imleria badia]